MAEAMREKTPVTLEVAPEEDSNLQDMMALMDEEDRRLEEDYEQVMNGLADTPEKEAAQTVMGAATGVSAVSMAQGDFSTDEKDRNAVSSFLDTLADVVKGSPAGPALSTAISGMSDIIQKTFESVRGDKVDEMLLQRDTSDFKEVSQDDMLKMSNEELQSYTLDRASVDAKDKAKAAEAAAAFTTEPVADKEAAAQAGRQLVDQIDFSTYEGNEKDRSDIKFRFNVLSTYMNMRTIGKTTGVDVTDEMRHEAGEDYVAYAEGVKTMYDSADQTLKEKYAGDEATYQKAQAGLNAYMTPYLTECYNMISTADDRYDILSDDQVKRLDQVGFGDATVTYSAYAEGKDVMSHKDDKSVMDALMDEDELYANAGIDDELSEESVSDSKTKSDKLSKKEPAQSSSKDRSSDRAAELESLMSPKEKENDFGFDFFK